MGCSRTVLLSHQSVPQLDCGAIQQLSRGLLSPPCCSVQYLEAQLMLHLDEQHLSAHEFGGRVLQLLANYPFGSAVAAAARCRGEHGHSGGWRTEVLLVLH